MWKLIFLAVTFAAVHAELLTEDADGNVHVLQKSTHKQKLLTQKVNNLGTHPGSATLNVHGNLNVEAGMTVDSMAVNSLNVALSFTVDGVTIDNVMMQDMQQIHDDLVLPLLAVQSNTDKTVLERLIKLLDCVSCDDTADEFLP